MSFLAILKGITAAAQVGTTIYSGIKQNQEIEDINRENREIAERNEKLMLKQQAITNALNLRQVGLSERVASFNMREAKLNREEREEERGYNRMQNAAKNFAEYLNSKTAIQGARLSPIITRGAR